MANAAEFKLKAPAPPKKYVKRDLPVGEPDNDEEESEREPMYEQLRKKWRSSMNTETPSAPKPMGSTY